MNPLYTDQFDASAPVGRSIARLFKMRGWQGGLGGGLTGTKNGGSPYYFILFILFMLSLFRVAPFSENTAFQGGPDIQNATT